MIDILDLQIIFIFLLMMIAFSSLFVFTLRYFFKVWKRFESYILARIKD